jgi:hypothetical protein
MEVQARCECGFYLLTYTHQPVKLRSYSPCSPLDPLRRVSFCCAFPVADKSHEIRKACTAVRAHDMNQSAATV